MNVNISRRGWTVTLFGMIAGAAALPTIAFVQSVAANPAVTADPFAPTQFSLGLLRTAGWRFEVGAAMSVTHLGVYDWQGDGLEINYPVGIWDSHGVLLTDTTVLAEVASTYIGGFRYAPTTLANLLPGEVYTIGYFQSTLAATDRALHFDGWHQTDPLVMMGDAVINDGAASLAMPDQLWPTGFTHWIGPSFQYTIIPAPGATIVFATLLLHPRSRRRK